MTDVAPVPNYKIRGKIQVSVALMYRRTNISSEPELEFKCNFESESIQYYYAISWIINKRVAKTYAPITKYYLDTTNLHESTLQSLGYKFGITIQCAVSVSCTVSGYQTNLQISDTFYAGIKILTPQLNLSSGSSGSIKLQPTIPLGCRRPFALAESRSESCDIDIEMFDPNSKYTCQETSLTTLSNQKLCGSKIIGWRNSSLQVCMHQHNLSYCSYSQIQHRLSDFSIRITVTNDQLRYPKDKTFTVQLKTGNISPHLFWKNARLDDVTVLYTGGSQNTEWMGNICSVTNDPSLKMFDVPSSIYLEYFSHYLMYRNIKYLAEVQIKTQLCDADSPPLTYTSSCTCAVAIQAGGDVFSIDICGTIKKADFSHCRSNVLNVREVNVNSIYLPTGTKVIVEIRFYRKSKFLKVFVHPSPSDVENTEGLCGNLNGRQDDTVDSTYFKTWELQHSLFNTAQPNLPSTWTYDQSVCICPRAEPNNNLSSLPPGDKDPRAFCFTQQYATCTDNINLDGERKTCTIRIKRSFKRHTRNNERLLALSMSEDSFNRRIRKSTVYTNLTEAKAYEECLNVFKSKPTYNMRNDLPDIAWNESLSACVTDMMVDGRAFWKEESYNSWISVMAQEIGKNETFIQEKSSIVRDFQSVTCPSQCNGNGKCVNGTCVCYGDYVGVSCFVNKSAPLELTDIEGGGECDVADGDDCHECLHFHTENLLKGFKCKIETNELGENGTVIQSNVIERNGEYESVFDGYCCPSTVEKRRKKRDVTTFGFTVRYSVSISNDGLHFGPGRNVHVFDSKCQIYITLPAGDLLFSLKPKTCYIEGQCYKDGESSFINTCLFCFPSNTSLKWTTRQDCVPPAKVPANSIGNRKTVIVAVSLSVSGIVIVAYVVLFTFWTYKSKTRAVATTDDEPPECAEYNELDFTNLHCDEKIHNNKKSMFRREQLSV